MRNIATEYRLLSTLRAPHNNHVVWRIKPELFTDERQDIFLALQQSLKHYGNASTEALEAILSRDLPHELDIPYHGDPAPLIDDLARLYRKRQLAELAEESKRLSALHDPDIDILRDKLATVAYIHEEDSSLTSGINHFLSDLHAKSSDNYRWLDTGVTFLNNMLGGEWPRGELTVITGGTGRGKSSLMNTSALNMARLVKNEDRSAPPALFSIEMPKAQLIARFVSDITGIDSAALRLGRHPSRELNQEERDKINAAVNELKELPLYIFDATSINAQWIIAQARELHRKHGVECIFIDYLQLIAYDGESKHYGLSDAGKAIRNFAKQHNIATVALAQIHADGRLRDVGDTDRDAGAIIQLDIDKDTADDRGICSATFEVVKNRHGPTGKYTALYDSKHVRFLG